MAADPQTHEALRAAVAAWTEQDFDPAQIDQFIALGERVLARGVFTPDSEASALIAAVGDTVPLPEDFRGLRAAPSIDGGAVLVRLEPGALRAIHGGAGSGTPRHFAIEGAALRLGPAPAAAILLRLAYWRAIPALGPEQASNWLLAAHPDLYLAAALIEAFTFHMDEMRAGFWSRRLADKIDEINRAGRRRGSGSGPLTARAGRAA